MQVLTDVIHALLIVKYAQQSMFVQLVCQVTHPLRMVQAAPYYARATALPAHKQMPLHALHAMEAVS